MVKNKSGGSKHKKMARKHVNASSSIPRKLREVKEKGEIYGRIVKVEGGSNFGVLCNDNVLRLLVVRKKFRGRNKRDNNLKIDTMVMVGLRDWEVRSGKKREKVDLLEVYNSNQIELIKKLKNINLEILPESEQLQESDNPFDIDSNYSNELLDEEAAEELNKKINKKLDTVNEEKEVDDPVFNWDDI